MSSEALLQLLDVKRDVVKHRFCMKSLQPSVFDCHSETVAALPVFIFSFVLKNDFFP